MTTTETRPSCYRRPAVLKTSSVIRVGLNATILAVTEEAPRVLTAPTSVARFRHFPSAL